ncbi:hypothetical protein [Enterococcus faecalis]|uniref:hypothetical protein n=1 Tax=Enterococcus faecalis TaxID=1351 RepID=UPI001CE377BC|nr:hypothetical protein [Enterococcus faecalis]
MDIKKKEALEKIIQLTNNALANPQIYSDKNLNDLLLRIRKEALSGEVFYDLKKGFCCKVLNKE